MKKNITILICMLYFNVAYTQNLDLTKGKIITLKGDTIDGYINSIKDCYSIQFKTNTKSNWISYTPISIRGFIDVNKNIYLSKFPKLATNDNSIDSIFVELIVSGDINYYVYNDNRDKRVMLIEKEMQLYELIGGKKQIMNTSDEIKLVQNRQYLGILSFLTKDCATAQANVNNIYYNIEDIANFIYNYNLKCGKIPAILYTKNRVTTKMPRKFGLKVGSNFSNIFSTGLVYKSFLKRNFAYQAELCYWSHSFNSKTSISENGILSNTLIDEKYNTLFVNLKFRHYNSTKGIIQPFLGYGISAGILHTTGTNTTTDIQKTTSTILYTNTQNFNTSDATFGLLIELGVIIHLIGSHELNIYVSPHLQAPRGGLLFEIAYLF